MAHLPYLDWVFLGLLAASTLLGAWRGLVYEVLSLATWAAAFYLSQWFAPQVAQWLPWGSMSESIRYASGFVLAFVGCIFAGSLLAFLMKKLISVVGLSPADRGLGAVFGASRGLVLLLAITVVVGMTPMRMSAWWQEATGPALTAVVLKGLQPVLPQEFAKYLP